MSAKAVPLDKGTLDSAKKIVKKSMGLKTKKEIDIVKLVEFLDLTSHKRSVHSMFRNNEATLRVCNLFLDAWNIKYQSAHWELDHLLALSQKKTKLPERSEFYEQLHYARFLAYEPSTAHTTRTFKWYHERIELKRLARPPGELPGTLRFRGLCINNLSNEPIALEATRVGPFLFTITGTHLARSSRSFQATFVKQFDGILSGTWMGIDQAGHSSQFRMFLAKQPIDKEQLLKLQADHLIGYEPSCGEVEPGEPKRITDEHREAIEKKLESLSLSGS